MSELLDHLREDLQDEDARCGYVESFSNAFVAAQIKTLREDQDLSQQELAEKIGTKQSGISRLENANYSSWKVETLRKLARAFGVRLRISFEEFGTLIPEIENFNKRVLGRRRFEADPIFHPRPRLHAEAEATQVLQPTVGDLTPTIRLVLGLERTPMDRELSHIHFTSSLTTGDLIPLSRMLSPGIIHSASIDTSHGAVAQSLPTATGLVKSQKVMPAAEIHYVIRSGHSHTKRTPRTPERAGIFVRKRRATA